MPLRPMAPGSMPPWPASSTTIWRRGASFGFAWAWARAAKGSSAAPPPAAAASAARPRKTRRRAIQRPDMRCASSLTRRRKTPSDAARHYRFNSNALPYLIGNHQRIVVIHSPIHRPKGEGAKPHNRPRGRARARDGAARHSSGRGRPRTRRRDRGGAVTVTAMATGTARGTVLRGILSMLLGGACFAVMDALVKGVAPRFPVLQIIFFRSLFAFLPILMQIRREGGMAVLRTQNLGGHLRRSLCGFLSLSGFVYAFGNMPLADVIAIGFSAPIFITALSVPLLGESVGIRRWSAVL